MKTDALAFFRILPAGAADVGDVSREELREAGAGDWTMKGGIEREDLGDLFPELTDFEVLNEAPEKLDPDAIELRFRESG